jgi:hypothetical protein
MIATNPNIKKGFLWIFIAHTLAVLVPKLQLGNAIVCEAPLRGRGVISRIVSTGRG